ncbi:hypothetical protein Q0Z83_060200 [Actinoplanes sichuanensis]|uniref:Virion structural protein n=1 Tax=Actinoplanes sichuanensis TaxID=512349 RepID=A0ABW4A616_9ACTN|nr:hypothetical protein [Actinoplanes sichuanensis]BEL07829.1 hypothetical protein Q0Z83_060200 [Actinoplanes sichuanensis]
MAQNRIYTVSFSAVAVTAAVDLFEITPADDKPCEVIGLFIGQSSDVGDAAAELLPYTVLRGHTTSGSGGTATTPRPLNRSDTAAGFTAETCNTTAASAGTAVALHADTFHVASGEKLWLPEGCEWELTQADTTLVVRLAAAPADSLTMSGTLYVREQG